MNIKKYYILYHKLRNTVPNFIFVYKNIFYNKKLKYNKYSCSGLPTPAPIPLTDTEEVYGE